LGRWGDLCRDAGDRISSGREGGGVNRILLCLRQAESCLIRATMEANDPGHELYCSVAARVIEEAREKTGEAIGRIEKA